MLGMGFLHILLITNGELGEENDCAVTWMNLIGNIYFNLLRYLDLNYISNFCLQSEKCFSTLLQIQNEIWNLKVFLKLNETRIHNLQCNSQNYFIIYFWLLDVVLYYVNILFDGICHLVKNNWIKKVDQSQGSREQQHWKMVTRQEPMHQSLFF